MKIVTVVLLLALVYSLRVTYLVVTNDYRYAKENNFKGYWRRQLTVDCFIGVILNLVILAGFIFLGVL